MAGIFHEEEPAVLYFVVDTSEERKLRSQLFQAQKMDAIGRLAGGVAHDFNNLLQAIQGYAELVGFGLEKEDPRSAHMQVITSAARKAGELTQSLLAFSRRIERTVKPLDLNREISEVVRLLGRTLPKMVNMQLRLAEDVAIVHADPVGIQQVVMNLCLNARDAMPDGGTLLIETSNRRLGKEYCDIHPGAVQGKHVLLSISDTGCGMTKEVVEQIFEPFFTTKETGKGTGLGLSVVYGIVKGHQGHILCYSEPGVGTDFRIYLPSVESEAEQKLDEELPTPRGGPETILLVDDEEWVRGFGRETLSRVGYTVLVAEDGRKGLELFKQERDRISLVILDLVMPEMGGWECLQQILRVSPGAKVLVASGHSGFGPVDDSLKTKAKGYISKPYDTRLLLEEVRRVLDQP